MMSLAVLLKFRPIYIHEINNIYSILNQTHYILLLMIKLYIGIIIFNCIIIFRCVDGNNIIYNYYI